LYENIANPYEWDFLAKYIEGAMAARGVNVYEAGSYEAVYDELTTPISPSDEFREEIFDVGFKYLPPFLFVVAPLGYLAYGAAQVVWFVIHFGFLLGAAALAAKLFLGPSRAGLPAFPFAFVIISLFPPASDIVHYGQTHFIILFFSLAIIADLHKCRAGAWVACASFIKPFGGLLGLIFLLRGKWRTILVGLITGVVALLGTALVFGGETVLSFFLENPNKKVPEWQYVQPINQSIPAMILRWTGIPPSGASPLFSAPVIAGILFFFAITAVLIRRLPESKLVWGFVLSIMMAILIYPGALTHYSIYLVIPIFLILQERNAFNWGFIVKLGIVGMILVLLDLRPTLANFFCWVLVAVFVYRYGRVTRGAAS
jgi:hypothetical protein